MSTKYYNYQSPKHREYWQTTAYANSGYVLTTTRASRVYGGHNACAGYAIFCDTHLAPEEWFIVSGLNRLTLHYNKYAGPFPSQDAAKAAWLVMFGRE